VRTFIYNECLLLAAEFAGLDPDNLLISDAKSLQRFLSERLKKGWEGES